MPLKRFSYILICSIFFLVPVFCTGQTFRYEQYTMGNGLPVDNVYAAAQDGDGFMWFATNFGVSRFDGHDFINYSKRNGINNLAIMDIVYAGGDSLVFISYPSTIQSIHYNGRINTLLEKPDFSFHQIARHQDEFYCYHRNHNKYMLMQQGKWQSCNADSILNGGNIKIHTIFSLKERGVAFCTSEGLYIKKGNSIIHLLQDQNVQIGILTSDNNILVVCGNTITQIGTEWQCKKTSLQLPVNFLPYQVEEEDGNIWFRNIDKGVIRLQQNELTEMSEALNLKEKTVNKFFTDRDGNFWINTDGNGILLKKRTIFSTYDVNDGLPSNKVLRLHLQKDKLYIGTENGIAEKSGHTIKKMNLPSAKEGLKYTFSIQKVHEGQIGISIAHTFNFKDAGTGYFVQNISNTVKAYNGMFSWQENKDDLWTCAIAYPDKIYKIRNVNVFSDSVDIKAYGVKKIYKMIRWNDLYWAGTDRGIIQFNKTTNRFIKNINGEKIEQVFDFLTDKKNRLWIATETGLYLYENNHFTTVPKSGTLGSNYCLDICSDDKDRIWAATWDGIFFTDGKTKTYFNTNDGLPSKTVNAVLFDSASRQLYAGTDNGLAILNSNAFETIKPNRILYTVCRLIALDGLGEMVNAGAILSTAQNNLSFRLSIPYYQDNGNIRFEYKLDNNTWTATGDPVITISDISSGSHIFYARAKLNGALLTKENAVFAFTIKTPFYQKWWFWIIVAVIFQGLLFWVINKYNRREREKKLAVQTQQAEYASLKQQAFTSLMNPHFIFNALNSVQYYVNRQDRLSANKYLSDFATLIRKSFDAAQKSFVTLDEELETIRLYLQLEKMRFPDKFDYNIHLSKAATDEDWMLPSMVLQPFLENAILHGLMPLEEKGQLTIEANAKGNTLYITITDTGMGIKKSRALRSGSPHKSRGMQLIKERLELLSKLSKEPIQLSITELIPGANNPGTKISLSIPQEVYEVFQQQRKQS